MARVAYLLHVSNFARLSEFKELLQNQSSAISNCGAGGVMLTLAARCGSIMAENDRYMGGGSTAFTGYALFGLVSSAYPLSSTVIDQLRDESLNP